jgi:hypothetical protein
MLTPSKFNFVHSYRLATALLASLVALLASLAALAATTMLLALATATMLTALAAYQSSERALYAVRTTRSNAGNTIRGLTESALQRVLGSGNQAKRNTNDHVRSILDNTLGRVD